MPGLAQRSYDVFHVLLREGFSYGEVGLQRALESWRPLLGERLLVLDDYRNLAELVVSAIQVAEGVDPAEAADSWSSSTASASVRAALALPPPRPSGLWGLFR